MRKALPLVALAAVVAACLMTGSFLGESGQAQATCTQGPCAPGAAPSSAGTVVSVALTTPSWLAVSGSPITSAGTLAVTADASQTANSVLATPNGSTGALAVRKLVAADLPTADVPLTGTTGSIGGSALLAGVCATGTATVTGVTTAMAIIATPVSTPGPGFYQSPAYVSASNTVTVSICAAVAGTPTASVYNVRAIP